MTDIFFIPVIADIIRDYSYEYSPECEYCNKTATKLIEKLDKEKTRKMVICHYEKNSNITIEKTNKINKLSITLYDEGIEKKGEIDIEYLSTIITHGIYQSFITDIFNKHVPVFHTKWIIGSGVIYGSYYYPTMIRHMLYQPPFNSHIHLSMQQTKNKKTKK